MMLVRAFNLRNVTRERGRRGNVFRVTLDMQIDDGPVEEGVTYVVPENKAVARKARGIGPQVREMIERGDFQGRIGKARR